jgi:hypothetical protein
MACKDKESISAFSVTIVSSADKGVAGFEPDSLDPLLLSHQH